MRCTVAFLICVCFFNCRGFRMLQCYHELRKKLARLETKPDKHSASTTIKPDDKVPFLNGPFSYYSIVSLFLCVVALVYSDAFWTACASVDFDIEIKMASKISSLYDWSLPVTHSCHHGTQRLVVVVVIDSEHSSRFLAPSLAAAQAVLEDLPRAVRGWRDDFPEMQARRHHQNPAKGLSDDMRRALRVVHFLVLVELGSDECASLYSSVKRQLSQQPFLIFSPAPSCIQLPLFSFFLHSPLDTLHVIRLLNSEGRRPNVCSLLKPQTTYSRV